MALNTAQKAQIVKAYQHAKNDTGSSEVQIALLSARIDYLTSHLQVHKHDCHTRHGLTKLVSKRRRLMNYLKRVSPVSYRNILNKLEMRG